MRVDGIIARRLIHRLADGEARHESDLLSYLLFDGGFAAELIELGRKKEHGFCCGGGGGRMWMEESIGTRVNNNRADEILATGAEAVAVACPFCTIMVTDGIKARNAEERVQILDVAEVIAKSIAKKKQNFLRVPEPPQQEAAGEDADA